MGSDQDWITAWQIERKGKERFFPIAPDASQGESEALNSLLYRFILQGNENNKSGFDRTKVRKLEQDRYDLKTSQCVADSGEYATWKKDHPEGGMPFGCPGLKRTEEGGYAAGEFDVLETWIKKGATGPNPKALEQRAIPASPSTVAKWEAYLNEPSIKQKLVSRYLYEHLFRARIHFDSSPGDFFELVRASSPPGEYPVREIVTAAPNDEPGSRRDGHYVFYYRLRKMTDLITIKDHLTWEADDRILARLRYLFHEEAPAWNPKILPGYESRNPFLYFQDIPPSIRYKFLLENARYIMENLVKSPVCNGSLATFAMDDFIWEWFLKPEADPSAQDSGPAAFSREDWETVNDGYRVNTNFIRGEYSLIRHNEEYLTIAERKTRILRPNGFRTDDVWDGSCLYQSATCEKGKNRNAWLSAMRHETNASVVFGGEGGYPISVFLFNFANFERSYYSLSFNYREWEGLQHKLLTWRDFMHTRLEAQDRFLSFLPEKLRIAIRHEWSLGWLGEIGVAIFPDRSLGKERGWKEVKKAFLKVLPNKFFEEDLLIGVRPGDPSLAMSDEQSARSSLLRTLDTVVEKRFSEYEIKPLALNSTKKATVSPTVPTTREQLENLMASVTMTEGFFNSRLASVSYLRFVPQNWVYTIVAHRRYGAHNFLTDIYWARRGQSEKDYISIFRGVVGDYPNIFFDIPLEKAQDFFLTLQNLKTDSQWLALRSRFMVPKNSDSFWQSSDWYHSWIGKNMPVSGGIVDLREYDNWETPPESIGK